MSATVGNPNGVVIRKEGAWPNPVTNEKHFGIHFATPTAAGTYKYYLGRTRGGLMVLRDLYLFSDAAIARHGSNYITFKPFVVALTPSGVSALHYIGTPRSTLTYGTAANAGFRIHEEESLDYHALTGMAFGVELVVTGTMGASVRASLLANLDYAG